MPSTHRPKLRRKDLKQPDEFMTLANTVQDFVEQHLDKVIIGTIAALVVAAAVFAIYRHVVNVRHEAAQQFYEGFNAFDAKNYKVAEQKFKDLIANQPSGGPGRLARFYLGVTYLNTGDHDAAIRELEGYTADAPDEAWHELALVDLGVAYEQKHELGKAVQAYQRAADLKGPDSANARLAAARVLQEQGKRDAAIEVYKKFLDANPYAEQRQTVIQALASLGVSAPASSTAAGSP